MHAKDGLAYFARAVTYKGKMFVKLTTGAKPTQHHFFFITKLLPQKARAFVPDKFFVWFGKKSTVSAYSQTLD
jgi:hypothetical protein